MHLSWNIFSKHKKKFSRLFSIIVDFFQGFVFHLHWYRNVQFFKILQPFDGQSITLNFYKALQENIEVFSAGSAVTWNSGDLELEPQKWETVHTSIQSFGGQSREVCLRLETELFEKVSVCSIKQKEGALMLRSSEFWSRKGRKLYICTFDWFSQ